MHEFLILLTDVVLLAVVGIGILLALVWIFSRRAFRGSLDASWLLIILGPILPLLSRLGIQVLDWRSENAPAAGGRPTSRFSTTRKAMDYLVRRIAAEAELDGAPLTEIEQKMLYFSEVSPTLPGMAAVSADFSASYDEDAYEQRIAGLVRAITARDNSQDRDEQTAWDEAVLKLSDGDYYLSVLVTPSLFRANKARPPHDILKLLLTAFAIVFAFLAFFCIRDWLFGSKP